MFRVGHEAQDQFIRHQPLHQPFGVMKVPLAAGPSTIRLTVADTGTGMDPEEESPWIGPGNRTRLGAGMVFTLKATITVPGVGGLRTERIVHLAETGPDPLDAFPMRLYW